MEPVAGSRPIGVRPDDERNAEKVVSGAPTVLRLPANLRLKGRHF